MSRRPTAVPDLTPTVIDAIDQRLIDRYEALRILTIPEAARMLGVSDRQVYRLVDTGVLAETRVTSGRIGIAQAVVAAYIRDKTNGPIPT
jgi:excisionase family DNA binding protein